MTKDFKYLLIIAGLLVINLVLFLGGKTGSNERNTFFSVKDTSMIQSVKIQLHDHRVFLEKVNGSWKLNDTLKVDPRLLDILMTLIQQVEVKREVGGWEGPTDGKVEIGTVNKDIRFEFASDPNQTKSFFIQNGKAKQVEVPGYRDNVADLFKLHPDQWRDRLIFDGSWRTIQSLTLYLPEEKALEIRFDERFYTVNGTTAIDSARVVGYLNQFQFFEANEMISKGRFPDLDSLYQTQPMAYLSIDDIKSNKTTEMVIYPKIEGDNFHLASLQKEGIMMVFDQNRINKILRSEDYFLVD